MPSEGEANEEGEAVFTWSALDHIDPTQGYAEPGDTGVSREAGWDFLVSLRSSSRRQTERLMKSALQLDRQGFER